MSKIARLFTVDVKIYEAARRRGINMSDAAEQGMRSALDMRDVEKKAEGMSDAFKRAWELLSDEDRRQCVSAMQRNPNYAHGQKKKIKNLTGVDVSEDELKKLAK